MTLTPCPSLRASACIVINTCLASFWPFLPLHAQSPAARLDSLFASIEPTVKWTLPRGAAAGPLEYPRASQSDVFPDATV